MLYLLSTLVSPNTLGCNIIGCCKWPKKCQTCRSIILHLSYESKEIKEITINFYTHRLILTTLNNILEGFLLRIGPQNEVTNINFQYILKHTRLHNQDSVNISIQSQWKQHGQFASEEALV